MVTHTLTAELLDVAASSLSTMPDYLAFENAGEAMAYWYVNPFTDLRPFARWVPGARINLNVPFAEKNAVKDLGAKWDPEAGKWHVHDKMKNLELFAKWMPSGCSNAASDAGASNASAGSSPGSSSAESMPPKKRPRSA